MRSTLPSNMSADSNEKTMPNFFSRLARAKSGASRTCRKTSGIRLDHALEEGDLAERVLELLVAAAERGLDRGDAAAANHVEHRFRKREGIVQRRREIGVEHDRLLVKRMGLRRDAVAVRGKGEALRWR